MLTLLDFQSHNTNIFKEALNICDEALDSC